MRQNNSVVRWCGGGVVIGKVVGLLWIDWYLVLVLWIGCGWLGNERTRTRALPNEKRSFFNEILTAALIPIIQFTVYSTVKTVYQTEPKKTG